ncbi:eRF1 methyltransferase catalytic subunit MTQ2 like protein [Verticillium longisporum]|nr:eRF1 methyltransferase catalytic subunit MTQ2 like protein [Verticillium longisporum]
MLPTPDTSHVPYSRVYEPSEDSYLFLDTLSNATETSFLQRRFAGSPPHVLEVGPGSGVVIGFVAAQAQHIFGTHAILTSAIDLNAFACRATNATVLRAVADNRATAAPAWLGASMGDLTAPLRDASVDVLLFNPPYVPSEALPVPPPPPVGKAGEESEVLTSVTDRTPTYDEDSYLLALSYAGGKDGMQTTDRLIDALPRVLSARGCAYVLLCAQNRPEEVKARIRGLGDEWRVDKVGDSGKQAGWEKLQIIRAWREAGVTAA